MFNDAAFYKSLTDDGDLASALNKFVSLLGQLSCQACESVVEIVFEILPLLETGKRFEYIENTLMKVVTNFKVYKKNIKLLLFFTASTTWRAKSFAASSTIISPMRRGRREANAKWSGNL